MAQYQMPIVTVDAGARFEALDDFTRAYIESLCWSECNSDREEEGLEGLGFAEMTAETVAGIVADCASFQADNAATLAQAYERGGYDAAQAGHDFWLTRNGHGTGFWDRSELEPHGAEWAATEIPVDQWTAEIRATRDRLKAESLGEKLSAAARSFGTVDVFAEMFIDPSERVMAPKDAWLYAASWGSMMYAGDTGAVMYGFDERCLVQSEEHRRAVLEHIEDCRGAVEGTPEDYDSDELAKLDSFVRYIRQAPIEAVRS